MCFPEINCPSLLLCSPTAFVLRTFTRQHQNLMKTTLNRNMLISRPLVSVFSALKQLLHSAFPSATSSTRALQASNSKHRIVSDVPPVLLLKLSRCRVPTAESRVKRAELVHVNNLKGPFCVLQSAACSNAEQHVGSLKLQIRGSRLEE
uniref:Uncharacterized protein n=1 Tax=Cyclopterus lumpus TaxID=8103 RepID=A0A8C2WXK4_CYCLU